MAQPVNVPDGYQCPLCPSHRDEKFFESRIVGAPVCEGCDYEISLLVDDEERPDDPIFDRLEALTGLSFRQYRRIALEELVEDVEARLRPENVEREARTQMRVTGRSLEEVARSWRELVEHYRAEIRRLNTIPPGRCERVGTRSSRPMDTSLPAPGSASVELAIVIVLASTLPLFALVQWMMKERCTPYAFQGRTVFPKSIAGAESSPNRTSHAESAGAGRARRDRGERPSYFGAPP